MAKAITSASASTDETLLTKRGLLRGFNIVDSGTLGDGEIQLTDGTGGQVLAHVRIASGTSQLHWFGSSPRGGAAPDGIRFHDGVVVDRISGTSEVTVYID
jgi:hypothetical protein